MNNVGIRECHEEAIRDMSVSDNYFVTASDDSIVRIQSFEKDSYTTLSGHNWDVRVCQYNPRLSLVASGGKDNLVKLWDTRTKQCTCTLHMHKNTVLCARCLNSLELLTGGKDQVIKQIDIRMYNKRFMYKFKKEVTALAIMNTESSFFFKNVFVAGMADGSTSHLQVFNHNVQTNDAHDNTVWRVNYHPVGHLLASGSMDQSVRFWSSRTENEKKR